MDAVEGLIGRAQQSQQLELEKEQADWEENVLKVLGTFIRLDAINREICFICLANPNTTLQCIANTLEETFNDERIRIERAEALKKLVGKKAFTLKPADMRFSFQAVRWRMLSMQAKGSFFRRILSRIDMRTKPLKDDDGNELSRPYKPRPLI